MGIRRFLFTKTVAGLLALAALAIAPRVFAQSATTGATGVCCIEDPISCIITTQADCIQQGGIYGGDNTSCFLNPFGDCTCGPGAGDCLVAHGTPGCELLECCEVVCMANPSCCSVEWDAACSNSAAATSSCGLTQFESNNVSPYAWRDLNALGGANNGNDCWGYVSPSGREYALMGVSNKLVVVEITDPSNPLITASVSHTTSLWVDVKVYLDHAYVVNESGGGLDVIDLSDVDNGNVTLVQRFTAGGYSSSHNVAIDTDSGFLYVCGSNLNGGRLVAYDLSSPGSPTFAGQVASGVGVYVHDAEIVTFTSGCNAGKQIAFCANGGTGLDIYDVTDKLNMFRLSRSTYPNLSYCHQVWLSEDGQFAYVNDETDGINETVVFDVSDLANPTNANTFDNGVSAQDHNVYVRGSFLYEAEYQAGLRINCVDDPLNPVQVGWFDTYPLNNNHGSGGAWSVYPFFPSKTVIVSDRNLGLFILDVSAALAQPACAIPGDIDGDGIVGVPDLLALLAAWGPCPAPCPPSCPTDIDEDCAVSGPDLLILLSNWE